MIEYEIDAVVNGHPPIRIGCSISPLEQPQHALLIEMRAVDPHLRIARLEQARLQQEANRELLRNLAHESRIRSAASAVQPSCSSMSCRGNHCANTPRSSSRNRTACSP